MIEYEWCVEETVTVDSDEWERGEIIDSDFADTLGELLTRIAKHELDPGTAYVVCLTRCVGNDDEGMTSRDYAYVQTGGVLDSHFRDTDHRPVFAVPKRLMADAIKHRELLTKYAAVEIGRAAH